MDMKPRLVCWYSHGAASLMATKLAIKNQPELYPDHEVIVACIHIEDEYHEPERMGSVEAFLDHPVTIIKDTKFNASVDVVIEKTRYMAGVYGARCTKELKKAVRLEWQRDDDVHVFGFDKNESHRTDQVLDTEPTLEIYTPLIDANLSKSDCFLIMTEAGLSLPYMYQKGYHNNNCVGCLKAGGAGYWNKIRVDFPEVFEKRSRQEYLLNIALVSMSRDKFMTKWPEQFKLMCDEWEDRYKTRLVKSKKTGLSKPYHTSMVPLRYLPKDAGSHKDLDIGDCGIICEIKK
ncbi:putative Phosphoadenosine phosphosulphate reductase [Vibrio phage 168E36-1]|nr:putative Phosphoadenosine phosphosulphate reductase [Vibrio phage 168E36-1]